jgi:hypothetical protein
VDINSDTHTASIRIGTRDPLWLHPRIPGESTHLFLEAENVIRQRVEEKGFPITLRFDTANSAMKQWILVQKDVLGFDIVEPDDPQAYRLTVVKTYMPLQY